MRLSNTGGDGWTVNIEDLNGVARELQTILAKIAIQSPVQSSPSGRADERFEPILDALLLVEEFDASVMRRKCGQNTLAECGLLLR